MIDFIKPPRPPAPGWLLLGIGMLAFACALAFWEVRDEQRQRHEQQTEAQALALEQARVAAARPVVPSAEERRLEQAMSELRRPWLATLQAIEETTGDPIYLLNWTIDPTSGRIQLDGEAPSFEQALSYAQALDSERALTDAQLASHEQVGDVQVARPTVKFTVVAHWRNR